MLRQIRVFSRRFSTRKSSFQSARVKRWSRHQRARSCWLETCRTPPDSDQGRGSAACQQAILRAVAAWRLASVAWSAVSSAAGVLPAIGRGATSLLDRDSSQRGLLIATVSRRARRILPPPRFPERDIGIAAKAKPFFRAIDAVLEAPKWPTWGLAQQVEALLVSFFVLLVAKNPSPNRSVCQCHRMAATFFRRLPVAPRTGRHAPQLTAAKREPRQRQPLSSWEISAGFTTFSELPRRGVWCPEEDSNLHVLANAST